MNVLIIMHRKDKLKANSIVFLHTDENMPSLISNATVEWFKGRCFINMIVLL